MQIEINDMVLKALESANAAILNTVVRIENSEEFSASNSVGEILREIRSKNLTEHAILKEFLERCNKEKNKV